MTVEWHDDALDRFADVYVAAAPADRPGLAAAFERITARLAVDPQFVGEARQSVTHRVWFHPPLVVWFDLIPGGGVLVTHVRRLRPRAAGDSDA